MKIPMNQHKEQIETKYALKLKLEELRHKHIMEELKFMAKNKVKAFERSYRNFLKNKVKQ